MLRWNHLSSFSFVVLVAIAVVAYYLLFFYKQRKMRSIFQQNQLSFLWLFSEGKWKTKLFLKALYSLCIIFALAQLQWGKSFKSVKNEGVELILLFDVSKSMLAEDVRPSRLRLAQAEIMRFLDKKLGDRIGLIAFANSSTIVSPLTIDRNALKMYVEALSTEFVSAQGTNFQSALRMALELFENGGKQKTKNNTLTKAIIIISDGEDNKSGALEFSKELVKKGIHIYTLAIGTEDGGVIPIKDKKGVVRAYQKNSQGKVVVSKTQGKVLKALAKQGKGSFYRLGYGGGAIDSVVSDLERMDKNTYAAAVVMDYEDHFQWFLGLSLVIFVLDFFIMLNSGMRRSWRGRYEV